MLRMWKWTVWPLSRAARRFPCRESRTSSPAPPARGWSTRIQPLGGLGGRGLSEGLDHEARDLRRHRRTAGHHVAGGGNQFLRLDRLLQIAAGPGLQRSEHGVGVVVHGEHTNSASGSRRDSRAHRSRRPCRAG